MSDTVKALALDTWAGRRYYPVEIVGETPKRLRIRLLANVQMPGARWKEAGSVVLVPAYAVRDVAPYKVEDSTYSGHIYGYGDETFGEAVDVRRIG